VMFQQIAKTTRVIRPSKTAEVHNPVTGTSMTVTEI